MFYCFFDISHNGSEIDLGRALFDNLQEQQTKAKFTTFLE